VFEMEGTGLCNVWIKITTFEDGSSSCFVWIWAGELIMVVRPFFLDTGRPGPKMDEEVSYVRACFEHRRVLRGFLDVPAVPLP
jgi:hypothetical protein